MTREDYQPGLRARINKKLIDLQDQLIGHAYGGSKLSDTDLIRYSAMVEVLKAVLQ